MEHKDLWSTLDLDSVHLQYIVERGSINMFGIPVYGKTNVCQEKLRKRKERFGIVMDTTGLLDNQAKKRMRAERFGINLN
ncbi:SAP domain-containing ribonucleoprotein-like [Huso huso]|uniref:SAP domain-containing ribonucleoprotein-like n=1 Tax=Huso huso TaxID=61971 RepID=A0ABR0ZJM3_HUSHU